MHPNPLDEEDKKDFSRKAISVLLLLLSKEETDIIEMINKTS